MKSEKVGQINTVDPVVTIRSSFIVNQLEESLEGAIKYGYMRAHKHDNNPSEDRIIEEILQHVMNTIHDTFCFSNDPDLEEM